MANHCKTLQKSPSSHPDMAEYCSNKFNKPWNARLACLPIVRNELNQKLENVFVKHYAPNHMPDPKGEWCLKENNSELHYRICSKVYQFIYTLVCNYMPIMRILAKAVFQISRSKGCSYTKCLCPKKESNATGNLRNSFKS